MFQRCEFSPANANSRISWGDKNVQSRRWLLTGVECLHFHSRTGGKDIDIEATLIPDGKSIEEGILSIFVLTESFISTTKLKNLVITLSY